MRGGSPIFFIFITVFIIIIDSYTFRGIRILTTPFAQWLRIGIHALHWLIPVIIVILLIWTSFHSREVVTSEKHKVLYFIIGTFILFYVPKLVFIVFQLANDLFQFAGIVISKFSQPKSRISDVALGMSRSEFLTKSGIIMAAIPFVSVIHGISRGRFNYKVNDVLLKFPNLPDKFSGFRVLQVSDWHIGSFLGQEDKVKKAVDLINKQEADIILFTGDMVNNLAEEMEAFISILKNLHAKHGVYSILGNHDYAEYVSWENEDARMANMERLFLNQKNAGFKLLRNESVSIIKDDQRIGIAGVENWGLPPFPQYGNLSHALSELQDSQFNILMSHDPSHWDAEIKNNSKVDLTLSGHTHGMQFGINIPGFKWSPVQWKYPRWSGLYKEESQYLYVNVGIGYIAFPGRVGFNPEITVFELHKT